MAEPTQPKTLSELKKQLLSQPAQTTSVRPKTLSELKAQTFKGVEEGKVGAIEN